MTTRKNVLITGASRGIGRAIALTLAAQGFGIIPCASKTSTPFQEICGILKSKESLVDALTFDVADEAAARASIEKLLKFTELLGELFPTRGSLPTPPSQL